MGVVSRRWVWLVGVGVASGSGWNLWVWLAGGGCGWNLWVWLVGVVVRRYVYRFPHVTYPYSSCICSFLQQHSSFLKCFSFLFRYFFVIKFYVLNNFFAQYKYTYGRLRASHGSHMKGCTCFIHEEAHTNECFISCDGHQLYAFMGRM